MKNKYEQIKNYMKESSLETRMFVIVLMAGMLTAFFSAIFTAVEGIGVGATLSVSACFVILVVIAIVAFVFKREAICHVLMCLVLNVVMLPITFFFCGGIRSGMILYFITSLYVVVPTISSKKTRFAIYLISLASLVLTFEAGYYWLREYVTPVTNREWHLDVLVSLILNALCIYLVSTLVVQSYQYEKSQNEELVARLEELAIRDELTGVYNRRELFRVLEDNVMRASSDDLHCMFIFDVDEFRTINDTYGHVFGDKVLREVARCLSEATEDIERGEIAARYSGEEFVAVFHDPDFETSYARAEKIRQEVEKLRFRENPDVRVTISGGVDKCNGMRPRYALRQVDDLLYLAKTTGKNQITRKF